MIKTSNAANNAEREYRRQVEEATQDAEARMAALRYREQAATVQINPMGCICPPGANKDCESPVCPRKGANGYGG